MAAPQKLPPKEKAPVDKTPQKAKTCLGEICAGKKEATLDGRIDKPSAALCPEPYHVAKTVPDFMVEQSVAETRGPLVSIMPAFAYCFVAVNSLFVP